MHVVFRADAGTRLGSGHVMRCLALADALVRTGFDCTFLCIRQPGHLAKVIEARGHGVQLLPKVTSELEDASETLKYIERIDHVDWVVVDHYDLGQRWEATMRDRGIRVLTIIDNDETVHVSDIVVNQNLGYESASLKDLLPPSTVRLIGSRYVMLRNEFLDYTRDSSTIQPKRLQLLVSFGGSDHTNETSKFLDAWTILNPDVNAHIVIGASHEHRNQIAERVMADNRLQLHIQADNMAELMFNSDLAIGTAGSTSWERCFTGLPSIIVTTAANQVPIAQALAHSGASLYLGDAAETTPAQFVSALDFLILNPAVRHSLAQASTKLIDGLGGRRIAALMYNFTQLTPRKATFADAKAIFDWRNDPVVRAVSTDSGEILWTDHLAWLKKRLGSDDSHILMFERDGVPIGVTRFEIDRIAATAEISLYLNPTLRGEGLGPVMYRIAEEWFSINEPEVTCLTASVQDRNIASNRLFIEHGYQAEYRHYSKCLQENEEWTI